MKIIKTLLIGIFIWVVICLCFGKYIAETNPVGYSDEIANELFKTLVILGCMVYVIGQIIWLIIFEPFIRMIIVVIGSIMLIMIPVWVKEHYAKKAASNANTPVEYVMPNTNL